MAGKSVEERIAVIETEISMIKTDIADIKRMLNINVGAVGIFRYLCNIAGDTDGSV